MFCARPGQGYRRLFAAQLQCIQLPGEQCADRVICCCSCQSCWSWSAWATPRGSPTATCCSRCARRLVHANSCAFQASAPRSAAYKLCRVLLAMCVLRAAPLPTGILREACVTSDLTLWFSSPAVEPGGAHRGRRGAEEEGAKLNDLVERMTSVMHELCGASKRVATDTGADPRLFIATADHWRCGGRMSAAA